MSTFVLEIGSEELPARFLAGEKAELRARFTAALDEAGIERESMRVMSTPRRAVLILEGVKPVQAEREEEISGPPVRVAYVDGKPSKALEGFVRTNAVQLADVYTIKTDKGEYVAVRKRSGGAAVADLLAEICPAIIAALPFGKRMKWGSHTFAYARPLRWVLAMFDDAIVPFCVGPVASSNQTCGHRIHGFGPFALAHANDYMRVIREQGAVEPEDSLRRKAIIEGGNALAAAAGGVVQWKESLLDEVQGLCEHPEPVLGSFDASFLEVPAEVLLTSMESHQKSFGLRDAQGTLMPYFLTVANLTPEDMDVVRHGWERVLRARLEDARFFWHQDLHESFETWLKKLDSVIFIGPIGTMGDKTRRLEQLCAWLAEQCGQDPVAAARAGRLSKADLVSGMVGEFDTLQGIMGGIYARKMGEPEAVAQALAEQYLPAGPESPVPASVLGALLSMADKADTLAGCFGLGMIPTGAADANGLRRCALGIIRIQLEYGFRFDIRAFFAKAQALYGERKWKLEPAAALAKLEEFYHGRVKNYFQAGSAQTPLVEAALIAGCNDVWLAAKRLAALEAFSKTEQYAQSVQTFKRVANIIAKQGTLPREGWEESLLAEDGDKALAATLAEVLPRFDALLAQQDYAAMLHLLEELRPAVDGFFDTVMVMAEDAALRENRLRMLGALLRRLAAVADFAALQI
ncbi:MAG: glycine--tRNA ligase subunit beta [Desulfovibrionaceae bacterium]|nr:glycine--tRNA ligase subunit beta [Desulfovibrionaceae bacterium]